MVAWLILGAVLLTVSMVFLATAARKHPTMGSTERLHEIQLLRQAATATVIPNRVAQPVQQLAVSFWEPPRIKGELER